jgi:hypothetical protein
MAMPPPENKIAAMQEMQRRMRTPTKTDDIAMLNAGKGGQGQVPPQGQVPLQGQVPPQRQVPLQGQVPPKEIKQDLNNILTATLPTGDSIAALAIQALLKNANLDIEGLVRAEEGGRLEREAGGGLMELAAGGEFSGMVEGEGHGMEDNVRMPIAEGRQQVGTLAVSPTEYVVDSYTMAALGNGNPDAGADVMDQVVENVRERAYGSREQPNEISGLAALRPMTERV